MRQISLGCVVAGTLFIAACTSTPPAPTITVTVNPDSPSTSTTSSSTTTTATTPPPATLQKAFEKVSPGVVRFEVETCDGYESGSGFLVSGGRVVTAAHVVEGAQLIRIIRGSFATAATVRGADQAQDVALVDPGAAVTGTAQTFASTPAAVGDAVATVGFSLGGQLAFHSGTINGLDRKVTIGGRTASGLIEHDAAALPGDSGAPLVNTAGQIIGIHDAGINNVAGQRLAVSAAVASPLVKGWNTNASPVAASECNSIFGFDGDPVDVSSFSAAQAEALHTLWIWVEAVNQGDWSTAASQYSSASTTPDSVRSGSENSSLSEVQVQELRSDNAAPVIWLSFVSRQPAGKGPKERPSETCTRWSQDYLFSKRNGLWLINKSQAHVGQTRNQPCA